MSIKRLRYNEEGFAAIIVAMVLILVLSLITVGFASQMQKEQRDALDNQLSTQAYYAAESGINDAVKALNDGFSTEKSNCNPDPSTPDLASNTVDAAHNVSYSCLLINPAPYSLEYGSIPTTQSEVLIITGRNASDTANVAINKLRISWQSDNPSTPVKMWPAGTATTNFPSNAVWSNNSDTGVLETEVVPLTSLSDIALTNSAFTEFLYPSAGGAYSLPAVSYTANTASWASKGSMASGQCSTANVTAPASPNNTPLYCNVEITNINAVQVMLRLKSIYSPSRVSVSGLDVSGNRVRLSGAQSLVDSTGKAQDVLRRIQVRVSSRNEYNLPEAAVEASDDICKLLTVYPGYYSNTCATP